jgi:hypothetical protein
MTKRSVTKAIRTFTTVTTASVDPGAKPRELHPERSPFGRSHGNGQPPDWTATADVFERCP